MINWDGHRVLGVLATSRSIGIMVQSHGIGHRLGRSRDVSIVVYRLRIGRYAK